MKNALANDPSHEFYVVELDGIAKFEYRVFVKALSAGLLLNKSSRTAALNCATQTTIYSQSTELELALACLALPLRRTHWSNSNRCKASVFQPVCKAALQ